MTLGDLIVSIAGLIIIFVLIVIVSIPVKESKGDISTSKKHDDQKPTHPNRILSKVWKKVVGGNYQKGN